MYHKSDDFVHFRQRFSNNDNFNDELCDLFNKKFKFRFNDDWKLPEEGTWFSVPPWQVKELEVLKSRLNFHKSQLNDFDIEEWSSHTRRRNPAGEVTWKIRCAINPEFLTQAWTKFYECARTYNIIPADVKSERKMVSLHLCEAPGAFITSLNHYLKLNHPGIQWTWVANTLNPYYEGNSPSSMISDDRFMFHTLDNWHFGVDNTGNLMDWENSQAIIRKAKSLGKVMLVTADGSIDCLQAPDAQEEATSLLHYCEITTALQALSQGGTLIFKLFTIFEHSTVSLLYLINHLFSEVNIYKPVTSRQGNSEVYAVCLNYKGMSILEKFTPVLMSAYGTELYGNLSLFRLDDIPDTFLKQIQECACYFCSIQCQVINNNLQAYLMQNNIALHRNIKKIRAVVADEFIWHYDLKPLNSHEEILKGILHEENKINMNPRYHRGSYTERQLYSKMSLREKLHNLNSYLHAEVLTNPTVLINEPVKWKRFYDAPKEIELTFTFGRPLQKINSSKFIFVPIFKLYQKILEEKEFKHIAVCTDSNRDVNLTALDYEVDKVLCVQEYRCSESFYKYEKNCFRSIMKYLRNLSSNETLVIQNMNALTHFIVSILYILSVKCFEKIGFTSTNGIVLRNLKDPSGLKYLESIETECDNVLDDDKKDLLNSLNVQTTNAGDFYYSIVFYNNTFYRNKCIEYLSKIEKLI